MGSRDQLVDYTVNPTEWSCAWLAFTVIPPIALKLHDTTLRQVYGES